MHPRPHVGPHGGRRARARSCSRSGSAAPSSASRASPRCATGARTCPPRGRCSRRPPPPCARRFEAGAQPVLTASDCSICIATLPEVVLHEPDVHVAWIDAHGDFNTPETTPSGFLGGMCLAAVVRALGGGRVAGDARPLARALPRRARPRPGRGDRGRGGRRERGDPRRRAALRAPRHRRARPVGDGGAVPGPGRLGRAPPARAARRARGRLPDRRRRDHRARGHRRPSTLVAEAIEPLLE